MFWSSNGSPPSEREPSKTEPPKRQKSDRVPRRQRPTPPESPISKRGSDMPPVEDPLLEDDEVKPDASAS